MKYLYVILVSLVIGFCGCEKAGISQKVIPDGTYTGTFQRKTISGEGLKANISITFSAGRWYGQSDMMNYPSLCRGIFKTELNKLIFENECAWTADFDWSLIVSGEYKYILAGDSLLISRDYGSHGVESYTDVYTISLPVIGLKVSPVIGTWVETLSKTDTIVFSPEYEGLYPVFSLNRGFRITEGHTLPEYFSGLYHYIPGENSISVNWFLSSNSAFNRYYFEMTPDRNEFRIGSFFSDPPAPLQTDTLTFIRLK